MPLYEHVMIARQDLSNTQAEGLIEHFGTVLSDNGGALHGYQTIFPPSQSLPLLGRQCTQDRLQRYAPAATVYLRARQDRTGSHHRSLRQEAT